MLLRSISTWWKWLLAARHSLCTPRPRKLHLCETLSLGERRFVSLVEYDRQCFLIGGTGTTLSLLVPPAQYPGIDPEHDDLFPTHRFVGQRLVRENDGAPSESGQ